MAEATAPEANPTYYGPGAYRFIAHSIPEYAQQSINMERKRLTDELGEDGDVSGYTFYTERVDF